LELKEGLRVRRGLPAELLAVECFLTYIGG